MNKLILITGGARSGKSTFAEKLSLDINTRFPNRKSIAYIATSVPMDDEFRERIKLHRERRGSGFETCEESRNIVNALNEIYDRHNVFLLECMTTWLGNLFHEYYGADANVTAVGEIMRRHMDWIIETFARRESVKNNIQIHQSYSCLEDRKLPDQFLAGMRDEDKCMIVISNEVGLGIVPENRMARDYRDIHGRMNQLIASHADTVFFIISGIPVRIK
jgi:adenosylcobinamide kinase / adenosylcobinamide-phosphate guanylyltransferase